MTLFARLSRLTDRHLAGLSLLFNLPFVVFGVHRLAFDTYVHIFLADHYRQHWWDLWEPRWYLGFSMASYPPLVHQLIALLSWPLGGALRFFLPDPNPYPHAAIWRGEELAYLVLLLAVLALFPLAVRSFARVFVGPGAAKMAAIGAIVLPALSLSAWSFGQLPTIAATLVVLLALTRGHLYLAGGRLRHLLQAVSLAALAGATHHAVFLLVPFAGAAVLAQCWLRRAPGAGRRLVARSALWVLLSASAVAAVLWPLLAWSRGQTLQAPIDHVSRYNLLANGQAALYFFWPEYGPLLLVIPWMISVAWRSRGARRWPLAGLTLVLFVMGLGGTTPLPRLLYGSGWAWLTYDRFAFWAAMCLLPSAGAALLRLQRASKNASSMHPHALARRWLVPAFVACLALWATGAGWLAIIGHAQPRPVDFGPLAAFLDEPAHRPYRYFTLGLGDQAPRLATLTQNGTPDGSYHTARMLPELRSSGLAALDTVKWQPQGPGAVRPFLENAQRYGARWAFVADPDFVPELQAAGWHPIGVLSGVEVWEKPGVQPAPLAPPAWAGPTTAAIWWGSVPLIAFALALVALARDLRRPLWPSRLHLASLAAALRPPIWGALAATTLGLWWVHVARSGSVAYVYFTYQSVLIFASDLLAGLYLALSLAERWLRREPAAGLRLGPRAIAWPALGLVVAAGLSVFVAADPGIASAHAAHLLFLFAWYVLLVNDPPSPALADTAFVVVLALQALLAIGEVATQSTAWLGGLHLFWPGALTPEMSGVSVVAGPGGERWLRAYGSLPHPNILAGFLLVGLGAGLERWVSTGRRLWLASTAPLAAALVLTFSRAGWLAAAAMLAAGVGLAWRAAPGGRRRLARAGLAGGALAVLISLPLLPMLLARVQPGAQSSALEQRSLVARLALTRAALSFIRQHPLTGVGAGMFVTEAARLGGPDLPYEPVHDLPLLVTAETGLVGGVALLGLGAAVLWRLWRRRRLARPAELWMGLILLGLLVNGVFDHFWWSLSPARLALVTVLGLWVGWGEAATRPGSPAG